MSKNVYTWLNDRIGFSRSQAKGFAVLLLLIIIAVFTPSIVRYFFSSPSISEKDIENWNHFSKILQAQRAEDSIQSIKKQHLEFTTKTKKPAPVIDLNNSDTTDWKKIRGIGSVLSKRILKYREALGGFADANQLYEVYGLDSVLVDNIISNSIIKKRYTVHQLNVKNADFKTLLRHPYLDKPKVHAIISYRELNENLHTDSLIKQNPSLDWVAVKPYIFFTK